MKSVKGYLFVLCGLLAFCAEISAQTDDRPRTIITTDGEVDDADSFIRVLLYANDLNIEGIIYSSSQHHWAGDGKGSFLKPLNRSQMSGPDRQPKAEISHRWIGTTWVQDIIADYAKCYANLLLHDKRYPSPEYLNSIVKIGNIEVEGDMAKPTEGSEHIKDIILDSKPGKVHLEAWGGTNTIARALLSIEEQFRDTPQWGAIYKKVCDKVVLNIIQDQDGTYKTYVAKKWPDIMVIYNRLQFFCFAYLWNNTVPEPHKAYLSGEWFLKHVKENHGALGAHYYGLGEGYDLNDPDDHFGEPEAPSRSNGQLHDFISEGDSPSYFVLFDFGLRNISHPDWGGLGGRYIQRKDTPNVYEDPQVPNAFGLLFNPKKPEPAPHHEKIRFNRNLGDYNPHTGEVDMFYPQSRWIDILQNDFAARMDWCVSDFKSANHAPVVQVEGELNRAVKAGSSILLKGMAKDLDGNKVSYHWWQYREAGTSDKVVEIENPDLSSTQLTIPEDAEKGSTFHIILQVTDNGTPALTRFQRVILQIQ